MHVSIVRAEIYKAEANDQMKRLKFMTRKSLFRSAFLFSLNTFNPRMIYIMERIDRMCENAFINPSPSSIL